MMRASYPSLFFRNLMSEPKPKPKPKEKPRPRPKPGGRTVAQTTVDG
jgi:hypothetical protein